MFNRIIKICGIRDAETARQSIAMGANLIGIVFHPSSPRYVNIEQAIEISNAIKKAGATPVAVFVNQTDVDMRHICEITNIQIIQLHGDTSRAHHHLLPDNYHRIYVLNVTDEGELKADKGFHFLNPLRDMILIDHPNPGEGKIMTHKNFHYPFQFPWLLAGGLTPHNVTQMINQFQPSGVDVSSGVERYKGVKDIFLIQQFITGVRNHYES